MTAFSLAYTLHVLAALVWVGGMFFAWMILRPAAVAALEGPARLRLWANVFQRFFVWVWVAVAILPISGIGLLQLRFNGFETAPRYVQDGAHMDSCQSATIVRVGRRICREVLSVT